MKLFLSLQKKIEAYEEEKWDEKDLFHPNPIPFTKKPLSQEIQREQAEKREIQGQKAGYE